MKRRHFIAGLGAAAASSPLPLRAQPAAQRPRIGVLILSTPDTDPNTAAFRRGLVDLGYVEGRNVVIEYRYAEGRPERLPALAGELVSLKPDVLFVLGGDVAPHLANATRTIPIVYAMSSDPVKSGLAMSLSRPGGNSTGFTFLQDELASKRLEFFKEAVPRMSNVAFLWNPDHADNELQAASRAAATLGVKLQSLEVRRPDEFGVAFNTATQAQTDAIYVVSSRLMVASMARIIDFASKSRIPLAGGWGAWAQAGGLISYGPDVPSVVRASASYVDRILKGARPGDLPVQQPTRFELLVNLKAAKTLGLTIPESYLLRADRIIE